ncbi:S1 family peptidase [Amycolatopsis sp. NPDC059027]|uniref:S1 family peptidase n=1 Tax=unclassified Amycolatopsis TaxID=2618356 RepID=UPI00366BEEA7
MKLVRFAMTLAGATLALAGMAPAASATEPSGAQPAIIGGQYASNAPWAARMFVDGRQACSATIIAPTWILTARHCAEAGNSYSFRVGSLDQTTGGTVVNGVDAVINPEGADLALIQLDQSVQATYSPLGTENDVNVGQTVQVYGWGATSRCGSEINCQSRLLKYANVNVDSVNSSDAFGGVAVQATYGDGITAGGDSGGPMMGNDRQVGVASTSDRQSVTNYTNITQYRSWIQQVAGV